MLSYTTLFSPKITFILSLFLKFLCITKNSLTYKNLDIKLNQTRYLLGYSLSRKNKNKINKSKKISFLSEDKYFKNKNGMPTYID